MPSLLVIAWDNADWTLLQPLLAADKLPNLAALMDRGASGHLATMQPQLDPLLWASLATGTRADRHGVLHYWHVDNRGALQAVNSTRVNRATLWDCADAAGLNSLVVNWPLTFPAVTRHGVIASEMFCRLAGNDQGLEPIAAGAVAPARETDTLSALRFSPAEIDADSLGFFVPDWQGALEARDPLLNTVRVALAETVTTHAAATELMARDDWQLAIVRYELLALLGPRFYALHPPQLHYVPDEAYDRYSGTLDAACLYLDLMLGVLVDQVRDDTQILLLSERGISLGDHRPADVETAFHSEGGAPWYRQHGVLVAAGSKVQCGAQIQGATLLDIVPTALELLELPPLPGLQGRVLDEALVNPPSERKPPVLVNPGAVSLAPTFSQLNALTERRIETGISRPVGSSLGVQSTIHQETEFNQAIVALDARDYTRGHELLEDLHREHPENERIAIHLARARRRAGDSEGARQLLNTVIAHPSLRPYELMQLARLDIEAGDYNDALVKLFRAEQSEGQRPQVHCQIGEAYLAMGRWEEAERAFTKAIERDNRLALAWRGMTATRLGQQRPPDAIEAALKAVELERKSAAGHYLLARALAENGQYRLAIASCDTCLEVAPKHLGALRLIIALYERGEHREWAAPYRERLQSLEANQAIAAQIRDFLS